MKILFFSLLILVGCGGGQSVTDEINFSETEGEVGYIHLSLSNSQSKNLSKAGTITHYKVRLEGNGFTPIEKIISPKARGVVIQGIPAGSNRRIAIVALNEEGGVLREGVVENFNIQEGTTQNLDIELKAVPLILNLKENDFLSNRRLVFEILTDPHHRLSIPNYVDVKTNQEEIQANGAGIARFYLGVLPAKDYSFAIFDRDSEKSSKISLRLWEGQDVFAAPLFAAGQQKGSPLFLQRLGESFGRLESLWRK